MNGTEAFNQIMADEDEDRREGRLRAFLECIFPDGAAAETFDPLGLIQWTPEMIEQVFEQAGRLCMADSTFLRPARAGRAIFTPYVP